MDKLTYAMLNLYRKRNSLSLIQLGAILDIPAVELGAISTLLIKQNYLIPIDNPDKTVTIRTPLQITLDGKLALDKAKQTNRKTILNEIRAWITAVIAVAAFIKSFFFP